MNLGQVHIVLWAALFLVVFADIVSTYMVLDLGGIEINPIPAALQEYHICLWPVLLLLLWGLIYSLDIIIKRSWRSDLGLILFPVPILIELYTMIGNLQVLRVLIGG